MLADKLTSTLANFADKLTSTVANFFEFHPTLENTTGFKFL